MARKDTLERATQISESHCGPAVVQMQLSALGIQVSQAEITEAAGVKKTIDLFGTDLKQLAKAVKKLAPQTTFWTKSAATVRDISKTLSNDYPVGVEWQGLFFDSEEEEDKDRFKTGYYGHYSLVKDIDADSQAFLIADPYTKFAKNDRIVPIEIFKKRWWDVNLDPKATPKKPKYIKDRRRMFIITEKNTVFPLKLKMLLA